MIDTIAEIDTITELELKIAQMLLRAAIGSRSRLPEIRHTGAPRIVDPSLDEYRTGQGGARCPVCGVFVSRTNEQVGSTCESCWVSPHHG